jgi:hypothetical protein
MGTKSRQGAATLWARRYAPGALKAEERAGREADCAEAHAGQFAWRAMAARAAVSNDRAVCLNSGLCSALLLSHRL